MGSQGCLRILQRSCIIYVFVSIDNVTRTHTHIYECPKELYDKMTSLNGTTREILFSLDSCVTASPTCTLGKHE